MKAPIRSRPDFSSLWATSTSTTARAVRSWSGDSATATRDANPPSDAPTRIGGRGSDVASASTSPAKPSSE
jgi:hypothetical protein